MSFKPTILIADSLASFLTEKLKIYANVIVNPKLNGDKLLDALQSYNPTILVVRSTKVTKEHLYASNKLALVIRAGAGYNTIDVAEASNRGICVSNCPGRNAIAVAELAMGHLLNMDRDIADNVKLIKEGKWAKKKYAKSRGLFGLRMGVLGCGQVGTELIRRAKSFGISVIGYDPFLNDNYFESLNIDRAISPDQCCKNCDILSIHLPLVKDTKNLINRDLLSKLNDNAYIINTSRGGVINEEDLLEMIKIKNFKVGLDVMKNEPKSSDKTFNDKNLSNNDRIYITHHIGASTIQASNSVAQEVYNIVSDFFDKGLIRNCVNLEKNSPAKYLLSVRHKDVVGVLAFVLQELRSENINIQSMNNVVFKGAKAADAKLELDTSPTDELILKLKQNKDIYAVELVQLKKSKL